MKMALKLCSALSMAMAAALQVGQDPCAGCTEELAITYQKCAMEFGDPCAEVNEAGLVSNEPGTKKDVSCCMKKEKHNRCLECNGMDCSFDTCSPHMNQKYYMERTMGPDHTGWENKAKKE